MQIALRRIRVIFVLLCFFFASAAYAAEPASSIAELKRPAGISIGDNATAIEILDAFLGVPYVQDGVVDEEGRYSFFAKPDRLAKSAGLNCSGYTLSAMRFLLNKNITVTSAKIDRKGDSGKGAAMGEDWDFGWDLIANISENLPRKVLLPKGKEAAVEDIDATIERGYDIQAADTWSELLPRLRQGYVYLLSFSQESRLANYKLVHYHAAFVILDANGEAWMYQTTGEAGKAYKRNISTRTGLQEFLANFASAKSKPKQILVLEVELPKTHL